jgi:ParB family chromosome partitioning protein
MKHDGHFVDLISARSLGPRIRMIPIDKIDRIPARCGRQHQRAHGLHPEQGHPGPIWSGPREPFRDHRGNGATWPQGLGLRSCPASIWTQGQRSHGDRLIENLQRKTRRFEEADGLQALADLHSYNHEQISTKIGKARSTITEILSIAGIPQKARDIIKEAGGFSRSTLVEIAKLKSEEDMIKLTRDIVDRRLTREDTRDLAKYLKGKTKKLKYFVYNFVPEDTDKFRMRLEFKKQAVTKQEIIAVLQEIIDRIRKRDELPTPKT